MASSKYNILKQKEREARQKHFVSGVSPSHIEWGEDAPNRIFLENGEICAGTCIRCKNPPCIKLTEEELRLSNLSQFPSDSNNDLCPTNAITWPYNNASPVVDMELCIGCGLCASRCPTYAIFFMKNGAANVNDDVNGCFALNKIPSDQKKTEDTLRLFQKIIWSNPIKKVSDKNFTDIYKKLAKSSCLMANEPNLFIRNILITLKIQAAIRRTGDTNIRMDIVLEEKNQDIKGVGEIEFGVDILNTPRNTLDNVAVLVSRYKIKKVLPIVFPLSLPNKRSDYWQVIKDIQDVLKLPIRTITLGVLLILLWNRTRLSMEILSNFYSDSDNSSNRDVIKSLIGKEIGISDGLLGIIEPQK